MPKPTAEIHVANRGIVSCSLYAIFVMFTVVVLTLIGLVLILTALDWKWIESTNNNRLALTHSILGITAASLAIVQVFFK